MALFCQETMSNWGTETVSILFADNIQQMFKCLLCNMLYVLLYASMCLINISEMNAIHEGVLSYSQYNIVLLLVCNQ